MVTLIIHPPNRPCEHSRMKSQKQYYAKRGLRFLQNKREMCSSRMGTHTCWTFSFTQLLDGLHIIYYDLCCEDPEYFLINCSLEWVIVTADTYESGNS